MKTQHTPKIPECFKGEFFVEVLENNDTGENTFNIMSDIPNGSLCEVINDISEDVAHEVVKRVNLHDELVKTLEYVENYLKKDNGQGGDESVWACVQVALKRAKGEV